MSEFREAAKSLAESEVRFHAASRELRSLFDLGNRPTDAHVEDIVFAYVRHLKQLGDGVSIIEDLMDDDERDQVHEGPLSSELQEAIEEGSPNTSPTQITVRSSVSVMLKLYEEIATMANPGASAPLFNPKLTMHGSELDMPEFRITVTPMFDDWFDMDDMECLALAVSGSARSMKFTSDGEVEIS